MIEQKAALLAGVWRPIACRLHSDFRTAAADLQVSSGIENRSSFWRDARSRRAHAACRARDAGAHKSARPFNSLCSAALVSGAGYAIGGLLALPLLAAATWWDPGLQLDATQAGIFVLWVCWLRRFRACCPRPKARPLISLLALFLLGVAAVSLTGVVSSPQGFGTLWHHWSVYVGAAEALLGGAIPFRDYPVQYGMGPTLLLAALCHGECWTGTYIAVAAANLLYLMAMAGCVVMLTRKLPMGLALVALAAMGCAILMWTGYPADFWGPEHDALRGRNAVSPVRGPAVFHPARRGPAASDGTPPGTLCGFWDWCGRRKRRSTPRSSGGRISR